MGAFRKIGRLSTEKADRNEKIIQYKRDHEDATLREIGGVFGISRQRVSVILRNAGIKYIRYG